MSDFYSPYSGSINSTYYQQQQQQQHPPAQQSSSSYNHVYSAAHSTTTTAADPYYQNRTSSTHPNDSSQPYTSNTLYTQQQQQQPTSTSIPSFWNPAVAAAAAAAFTSSNSITNNSNHNIMLLDMGFKAGQTFLDLGTAKMIPGLEKTMKYLRIYFAETDTITTTSSSESSLLHADSSRFMVNYALPHSDDNAFDLYIPSMSLITYVLLCGLCYGAAGQFDPQVLQSVTTKCFVTQMIEVIIIRFGFYLMQASIDIMDLFAVTGYKYLGLCMNLFIGMLLMQIIPANSSSSSKSTTMTSYRGYYVSFFWTASSVSYFMLKTMANNIPRVTAATGPKREIMVLSFAASQFVTMWFLGQTKFLK